MASNKEMEFRRTEFEARGEENWRSDRRAEFNEYARFDDQGAEKMTPEKFREIQDALSGYLEDRSFTDSFADAYAELQAKKGHKSE